MTRPSIIRSVLLTSACLACFTPAWAQDTEPAEPAEEERTLQTVVIRGEFIPDEKRSTSEVSSLLDAEDFQIQGDSNAAAALARVAGVATADDQFIYVRGLNERYSSATLNGSPLPSPAPLRRVAPLDLFPTSALDSVLVQKTYSPNLPGEFGGGIVELRTKAVPDARFLEVSLSTGGDTETTFADGLLYDGSDTDWLGYDDGARDFPNVEISDDPDEFGRQLTDNSSLLVVQEGIVAPNFGIGITGGERFDLSPDISMGVTGSVNYDNSYSSREGVRGQAFAQGEGLGVFLSQDRRSTAQTVGLNGLGVIGFDLFDDHEIKFTGLVTRSTEKEARTVQGIDEEEVNQRIDSLEFFERQLWTTQVQGTHYFPALGDLKVEWRGSYSEALRDAPYEFEAVYFDNDEDGIFTLSSEVGASRFDFSRIDDEATDFGIDFTLPLSLGNGDFLSEVDLKAGYAYTESDRFATSRIFDIEGVGATDGTNRLDYIYSFIFGNGIGSAVEVGGNAPLPGFYQATLEVDAAYIGIDAQLTPYIRAAIGGRYEDAIEAVDVRATPQDEPTAQQVNGIEEEDFLPAATITWNPPGIDGADWLEDLQVRFGYSETITRPQFRELAPAVFVNSETDVTFFGNPFLTNASIKNYDARAEYYFARGQFLTVGAFYKDMENPIEEVLVPTENLQTTFLNAPAAELYGVEFEYEQVLPFDEWFGGNWFEEKEFTVKTNYTWSDSSVDAVGEVAFNIGTNLNPVLGTVNADGRIEDGRRLQGQSEHLFNFQIGYADDLARSEANLLINFVSERIRSGEIPARNIPAIIEEPPTTVDFVYNRRFDVLGGEYEFSFNVENILGDDYEAYQERGGDRVDVDTYELGTAFSVGLKRFF